MKALKPLQYFIKTALLLTVILSLSAFLSYMVFERLHEQYFLSTTISSTGVATGHPHANSSDADSGLHNAYLNEIRTELSDQLSKQSALLVPDNATRQSGTEGDIKVSLANASGAIQNSTSGDMPGTMLPSDYQLKSLPVTAGTFSAPMPAGNWRYSTEKDHYNVVIPLQEDSETILISMDRQVTESGRIHRQEAVTNSLLQSALVGLLVLSVSSIFLAVLVKFSPPENTSPTKRSRMIPIICGALTIGAAHAVLFATIWQDIESDLTLLLGNTLATQDLGNLLISLLTDNITVMLIAFLISIELSILLFNGSMSPATSTPNSAETARSGPTYKSMRPAIFLFLFAIDLAMSILPLHMERLYVAIPGLSREFVLGLPISVEFLCVGIAIFVSGAWLDRKGWKQPFACGLVLTAAGGVYSWLAPDAWQFILSRALLGSGYGLTLLAAQGFVIRHTNAKTKTEGLAHLFAGLYSGSICGAATGAMIAERYGYAVVFVTGALLVITVATYAIVYLRKDQSDQPAVKTDTQAAPQTTATPATSSISVWQFLRDPRFIAVALLSSFPAAIGVIGFLHYFTPVYLSRIGVAESQIGQTLMLYGICLTLLGPAIGRLADRATSKKFPIMIGGILASLAFLSFAGLEGIYAATVAVVLLGLSGCFVLPSQSAYVLQLDVSKQYGEGKALGIFRASSRIGQMLGPIVFSTVASLTDMRIGVATLGAIYLITVILFQILAARESTMVYKMESTS
ncbi:MFS transporter [Hahella sp. CCB-MM4]|uniref:MFS transporter n=1 Tax=Hahella sp. (strain CCB-MM4) TaxID=1926491 RepID=UPI001FEFD3E2|nr:MFS transporter [Hahella sp. CCB-MM4]